MKEILSSSRTVKSNGMASGPLAVNACLSAENVTVKGPVGQCSHSDLPGQLRTAEKYAGVSCPAVGEGP